MDITHPLEPPGIQGLPWLLWSFSFPFHNGFLAITSLTSISHGCPKLARRYILLATKALFTPQFGCTLLSGAFSN